MANPFHDFVEACAAAPSHWAIGTLHGEASGGETAAADLDPTADFFSSLSSFEPSEVPAESADVLLAHERTSASSSCAAPAPAKGIRVPPRRLVPKQPATPPPASASVAETGPAAAERPFKKKRGGRRQAEFAAYYGRFYDPRQGKGKGKDMDQGAS